MRWLAAASRRLLAYPADRQRKQVHIVESMKISAIFKDFSDTEKASGLILIACTVFSLIISNSSASESYIHFFHSTPSLPFLPTRLNHSIEQWINDGLMAIFFLLVGLEIERELYIGELSDFRNALLPLLAAAGGMLIPAGIHYFFNAGSATQAGFGIPMATDIAFALGILSLAGNKIPGSLKIFLTALAIIDDLGAIIVIAIFYTNQFSVGYFATALIIFLALFIAGKKKMNYLPVFIVGGVIMWYCMLQSGVHATIAGVLLAFAIPFQKEKEGGLSAKLQHSLHKPVAFIILPLFALANTAIVFPAHILTSFTTPNSIGIMAGLLLGKFAGIFFISWLAVKTKLAKLADNLHWTHLLGASLLGGIGFTMSIFITQLAFTDPVVITASKISILVASVTAAVLGLFVLKAAPASISPSAEY
ncbi:MAG: Na+/H+ antiporter NhaA [Bacteroidota bacterium]